MLLFNKNRITWQLQLFIWVIVFILSVLSNLQYDPIGEAVTYAVLAMLFYAVIIYGNASWLIPGYYDRKKYAAYGILLFLLLALSITGRNLLNMYIYNHYFTVKQEPLTLKGFVYTTFAGIVIFLFSVFYRFTLNYFELSGKQAAIRAEQIQTELNLLKQQVQPHFLFNTLNNIYYVAQRDSPEAAELIERLSAIIRYFMEESKKEKVFLRDEVALLKSYIELEGIRMRYEMPVEFIINGEINNILVPPLLLLPLTENIYKHGIDKRSKDNFAKITLNINGGKLEFATRNRMYPDNMSDDHTKTGLDNLKKRLQLYYDNQYELAAFVENDTFIADLSFPVDGI